MALAGFTGEETETQERSALLSKEGAQTELRSFDLAVLFTWAPSHRWLLELRMFFCPTAPAP